MHQKGAKKLYLRFYKRNGALICEVEDNGIGRKKSAEIRKLNPNIYPSKATNLTEERLRIFNSIAKDSLDVKVIDLKDKKARSLGTKVVLTINSNFKGHA